MSEPVLCTEFPAPGLRNPNRYITGHDADGKAVFLQTDHGSFHDTMLDGLAAQNTIYSCNGVPVELTDDADLKFNEQKPPLHVSDGYVVRMYDFAPGAASTYHRSLTLAIGTPCEGEFELSLGDDENRILRPGDVSINRGTMHRWTNLSADKSARMLFVILDIKPLVVNGKTVETDMGIMAKAYIDYEGEGKGGDESKKA